jgi:hypothetical protein
MGFMDKAKKMAEQAQAKLDEAQKQFNSGQQQGQQSPGTVVEYDKHGRPIAQEPPEAAAPPHGDPLAGSQAPPPAPPAPEAPAPPAAAAPPATPAPPAAPAPPAQPTADAPAEDRNNPSYAPPKLSSGDPLAG